MKAVDEYIKKQKSPQKEIIIELRKIILDTFPKITEDFKNGVPWYGKYYIVGLKDHVNIGFSISGLSKEDMDLFEGNGKLMRHIKIYCMGDIDKELIVKLLKVASKSDC